MKTLKPKISTWYSDSATGDVFEVIAIDPDSDTIEYQLSDGELGEFDQATWDSLNLTRTEAPDHWSDNLEDAVDDGFFDDAEIEFEHYSAAMTEYDRDIPDFDDDAYMS